MNRPRLLNSSLVGVLLALLAYSVYLSLTRIYQVDECQNFYMARIQAMGQASEYFTTSSLFLRGPLSWLATAHLSSAQMYAGARLVFLAVFWLNLLLLARIAGGSLFSTRGLFALAVAATLAPMWDYGFEIRHDNLVLTGTLLIWWLARARPADMRSYVLSGMITVAMVFVAVKAVIYVIPLSFAIVVFPPAGGRFRWRAAGAWLGGALLGLIIVRLCFGFNGAWDNYLNVFRTVSKYTAGGGSGKFKPWDVTLSRLLYQTPLLLALVAAALIAVAVNLLKRKKAALSWDGLLPEALLFLGAFGALVTNPTPFPYNLVNLVPFAFILAFKYAMEFGKEIRPSRELWIVIASVLIFVHLAPFTIATYRHVYYTNDRQQELMSLAEEMTDPSKDPVYDAIGMVPTRPSVNYHWYLHSLAAGLMNTPGSRVRDILAERPAAVFIPSYRTDWLASADHEFIAARYIPLANDFEVLGKILPSGGGSFEIFHPGRYCVVPEASLENSGATTNSPTAQDDSIRGSLDGAALAGKPVELTLGTHRLECSGKAAPAIVWVGPNLDSVPRLEPGDHHFLFQNWY